MRRHKEFEAAALLRGEQSDGEVALVEVERYFQQMAARQARVEPPPEALEPWPEVVKVGPPIGPG